MAKETKAEKAARLSDQQEEREKALRDAIREDDRAKAEAENKPKPEMVRTSLIEDGHIVVREIEKK